MSNKEVIVALCYDFDKTLSPKSMQEYTLIPKLLKCDVAQFWKECNAYCDEMGVDSILACMYYTLVKAKENGVKLSYKKFQELGKYIELFQGVESWFERINNFASSLGIRLEHYIISAGLKEMIEGTQIAKYFSEIFATNYLYNDNDEPVWLKQLVNYSGKTQYIARISKGCLNLTDERAVNEDMPEKDRRIPMRNIIYLGDSDTDIPAMRMVKGYGGTSIAVYTDSISKVSKLLQQQRIDYLLPADYRADSPLDKVIQNVLLKVKSTEDLNRLQESQKNYMQIMKEMQDFVLRITDFLQNITMQREGLNQLREYVLRYFDESSRMLKQEQKQDDLPQKVMFDMLNENKENLLKQIEDRRQKLCGK